VKLQNLKPAQVREWQTLLLKSGGKSGRPLAARTVGHCHRLLHRALEWAVENETPSRNVAGVIGPPKGEHEEVQILEPDQIIVALNKLQGHSLNCIAVLAPTSGGTPRGVACVVMA
jgi:hypothetical protein